MALVGFTAQQCVRRPWSTSWRVSGWDDLGDYQQSGALAITIDESAAQPGGCTQATVISDGSPFLVQGQALPGWVSTPGTRNLVFLVLVGDTLHAIANGATLARAMGLAGITAAGSVVLGQITSSAVGLVLSPRVGAASVSLGAVVSNAAGVVGAAPVIGSSSVALGPVTSVAAGTVASADVLTFGGIANGSFSTSGSYQTVTGAGSGSWNTRAQAYASNRRLQVAPSSDVSFSMAVATPATECVLVGVNLDNLQSTVFTSGVFGCYGGGASYSPAGAGLVNTVPCAAGDTVRVRRSILNGTQDRLYAEVASAAAPSTWTVVCQLTVSNTTPYYPMISAATAFAAAVVKCNGAAA